jgi:hypothetical protein
LLGKIASEHQAIQVIEASACQSEKLDTPRAQQVDYSFERHRHPVGLANLNPLPLTFVTEIMIMTQFKY